MKFLIDSVDLIHDGSCNIVEESGGRVYLDCGDLSKLGIKWGEDPSSLTGKEIEFAMIHCRSPAVLGLKPLEVTSDE